MIKLYIFLILQLVHQFSMAQSNPIAVPSSNKITLDVFLANEFKNISGQVVIDYETGAFVLQGVLRIDRTKISDLFTIQELLNTRIYTSQDGEAYDFSRVRVVFLDQLNNYHSRMRIFEEAFTKKFGHILSVRVPSQLSFVSFSDENQVQSERSSNVKTSTFFSYEDIFLQDKEVLHGNTTSNERLGKPLTLAEIEERYEKLKEERKHLKYALRPQRRLPEDSTTLKCAQLFQ